MVRGYPDWQRPINIAGQELAALNIDLVAQTLAKLDVDIIAQTLANLSVDITAQTLAKLDVDIIAQTLANLSVDIAAQTLANLKVDINAQTLANLSVDIAAQTLSTLGINITAQDLAELVIKINAQAVGIYVIRDWAAKEDEDKSITGYTTDGSIAEITILTYTVPANKVVYMDELTLSARCSETERGDFKLYKDAVIIWHVATRGEVVLEHVFTTPVKFIAAEVIKITKEFTLAAGKWTANLGGRELAV